MNQPDSARTVVTIEAGTAQLDGDLTLPVHARGLVLIVGGVDEQVLDLNRAALAALTCDARRIPDPAGGAAASAAC